ncbi:MAG: pyridoxal phosphate-dependent decarboxylase family protein [Gemmatimonadaceae bacterium]
MSATPTSPRAGPRATPSAPAERQPPLEMAPAEFRALGHALVDRVADFLGTLPSRPVTPGETPAAVRAALGGGGLPGRGTSAGPLLDEAAELLFAHSLLNGHPRFWGYITSSAAPLGALGDLLAAAVNPNVGGWALAPLATEVEAQTVRWIAELLGYPATCGGILVSGGNVANFVGFLAARRARLPWDVRREGLRGDRPPLAVYASTDTHTWLHKAADLFGLGLDAVRWIPVDARRRMDADALARRVRDDRAAGALPFLVVGTAGSVSVGAVDPLDEIAALCRDEGLWLHVDGAYGAIAAALPDAPAALRAIAEADSVAVDPHKWLYCPLEAGCTLVRDPRHLVDAFSFHPEYYNFGGTGDEAPLNYYELGPQNSRGFRALKVWLALRRAGREGIVRMVGEDVALAGALHAAVAAHPELEARTLALSIATFRYLPRDLAARAAAAEVAEYLNALNRALLDRLQVGGEAFVSNAVLDDVFLLRACIVNFRTTLGDVEALPEIVARHGRELDGEMRPAALRG